MDLQSKHFNYQQQLNGYLPKSEPMLMLDSSSYSYIYLDSYQNAGPSQNNAQTIQNQIYRSDMIKNYRIGCDQITVFDDLYNVNSYNNKMIVTIGLISYNIVFTPGRYKLKAPVTDPLSLAKLIQDQLNVIATPLLFTVNVQNGVLSINRSTFFSISYANDKDAYYATKLHGIKEGSYSGGVIYNFTPPFCYTNLIYFRSDIQKYNKNDEDGFDNRTEIIASINLYNTWDSCDTTTKEQDVKFVKFFLANEQISAGNFAVSLFDDFGQPLNIQSNSNFRYILRLVTRNVPN